MKITAQPHIINAILEALETCTAGIGIAMRCDITHEIKGTNSWIEITEKQGIILKPADWFWFGYYLREYVE